MVKRIDSFLPALPIIGATLDQTASEIGNPYPSQFNYFKFVKLIECAMALSFVSFVGFGVWTIGVPELDKITTDKFEEKIFPISAASSNHLELKKQIEENKSFLLNFFKSTPAEDLIKNINIKTRLSPFWLNGLERYSGAYADAPINILNMPIKNLEGGFQLSEALKRNASLLNYMSLDFKDINHAKLFLNFSSNDKLRVVDFIFFHEFSHIYFDAFPNTRVKTISSAVSTAIAPVPANSANYINPTKSHNIESQASISFSTSSSILSENEADMQGLMLLFKKHAMTSLEAIDFIDKLMAFRYSDRQRQQSIYRATAPSTHDTEYSLYRLSEYIKTNSIEPLMGLSIEGQKSMSIDYAQKAFYFSLYNKNLPTSQLEQLSLLTFGSTDKVSLFQEIDREITYKSKSLGYVFNHEAPPSITPSLTPFR